MPTLDENLYLSHLSIDCVVFGYADGDLKVLLNKLSFFEESIGLPGGFIHKNEDIDQAAKRILFERTSLENIYLEQFKAFGKKNRSDFIFTKKLKNYLKLNSDFKAIITSNWMKQRFISLGYYALVDINKVKVKKNILDESAEWYSIQNIPKLIYDHNEILFEGLKSLRNDFDTKLIGFNLLPETFTMKDIQLMYESVFEKTFARNNFQKKILDFGILERLEKKFTGAANKAPYLYKRIQ
jgi:8-oxo-dGTP diphosphatase